jgi:hypothetical protein
MRTALHNSPCHMELEKTSERTGTQPDVKSFAETELDTQRKTKKGKAALHHVRHPAGTSEPCSCRHAWS